MTSRRKSKGRKAWKRHTRIGPKPIVVRLWGIRRAAGIPLKDLAKRMGYHWTTLSRWENGHKIPGFLAVHDWCEALGVKLTTEQK